jgi:hypothetical protein
MYSHLRPITHQIGHSRRMADAIADWEMRLNENRSVQEVVPAQYAELSARLKLCMVADSFSKSLAYYLYTGRKGLWLYTTHNSFALIAWHPNVLGRVLIFLPDASQSQFLLQELLDQIPPAPNGIQLARLAPAVAAEALFWEDRLSAYSEPVLDWIYPCRVLDTAAVVALRGNRFGKIRQNINGLQGRQIGVAQYIPSRHKAICQDIIRQWAQSHKADTFSFSDLNDPYEEMLNLASQPSLNMSGLILAVDGRPCGLSLWDVVEQPSTGLKYANCFADPQDKSIRGLSELNIYTMCQVLHAQGIQRVNLGGSETAGLDRFKRKLQPVESYPLVSTEVQFNISQ